MRSARKMQLLALLLVLTQALLSSASSNQVFYVKANNLSRGCPAGHVPCLTLDEYVQQDESYFTAGATFLFLSGNHSLHTTISLKNVSDISLQKERNDSDAEAVTLLCKTELAIRCNNVTNFTIQGMAFILYTSDTEGDGISVLSIVNSKKVFFLSLQFLLARAVICKNSDVTIASSLFEGNTGTYGGAVYASKHCNVTIASSLFEGNTGTYGGAVYASDGSGITLIGDVFIGNHASNSGGAVLANGSSIYLTLGNNFTRNSASHFGGAISCLNSNIYIASDTATDASPEDTLPITGEQNFPNGEALHCGEAFSCYEKTNFKQHTQFSNNEAKYGGAISLQDHSVATFGGTETIFCNNSGYSVGGAVFSYKSVVTSNTTHLCFTGNRARVAGGAYFGNVSSMKLGDAETNQHFENNSAATVSGGAIHFQHGTVNISGSSRFVRNSVTLIRSEQTGGAIYGLHGNFTLSGRALLAYNSAMSGGAIYILLANIHFDGTAIEIANNSAYSSAYNSAYNSVGGGVAISNSEMFVTTERLSFVNNSVIGGCGGGLYMTQSGLLVSNKTEQLSFTGNSAGDGGGFCCQNNTGTVLVQSANFINNSAWNTGGAILAAMCDARYTNVNVTSNSKSGVFSYRSNVSFDGHTRMSNNTGDTGAGLTAEMSSISFDGVTTFENNTAFVSGGAVTGLTNTDLSFRGITSFLNNNAIHNGGAVYVFIKTQMLMSGLTVFQNNTAIVYGGAIYAFNAHLILNDTVNFTSNRGDTGGGVYLQSGTTMTLMQNTTLSTSHNRATDWGGAIFNLDGITFDQCNFSLSEDRNNRAAIIVLPDCFLDLKGIVLNDNGHAPYKIHSYNDSAGIDGSFMFGGLIDKCRIITRNNDKHRIAWDLLYNVVTNRNIFDVRTYDTNTNRAIASEAYLLCFCERNGKYNCSKMIHVETYRGRKFTVSVVALSQGDTIMSVSVLARTSRTARVILNESSQVLPQNNCSGLAYNMYSTEEKEQLILYPHGSCRDTGLAQAVVNVTFRPCPDAFILFGDGCICEQRLQAYNAECTIFDDGIYIVRKVISKFWVSALYSKHRTYQGLILYQTCPVEYCMAKRVNITLDRPDVQCNTHRSGVLCGACATNYSLMLGSSKCEECSNRYLALLVAFAVAGLVLVAFLSFVRLTVATGMINSIILYANIVQANRKLFFPKSTNILTVFIAWMNLDLGFETCFYHGMDAYAQTWFQFAFPIYVWLLIGLIILTSRYSTTMTKLIGSNPIAVLATLLLMSYTKILKTTIEVYSSVKLDYPDDMKVTVWLKDANVPYLQSKHLALAVVASVLVVFLFLPYTIFLLLGHKLYRFSGGKYFRWLKPLLDSYYAPYQKHTRYWTGFLLLIRCALYIVFSYNSLGGTTMSLLAIIIAFTAIIVIAWLSVKIYTSFYTNAIEALAYLNLIVLAATKSNDASSPAVVYTLVGIVFATMMGITVYHFHLLYTAKSKPWQKMVAKLTSFVDALKQRVTGNPKTEMAPLLPPPAGVSSKDPHDIVTKTVILREQLLTN